MLTIHTTEIVDLMVDLNRNNGQTFIMVTHALDVGERAHRIVNMRDGVILNDGLEPKEAGAPADSAGSSNEEAE